MKKKSVRWVARNGLYVAVGALALTVYAIFGVASAFLVLMLGLAVMQLQYLIVHDRLSDALEACSIYEASCADISRRIHETIDDSDSRHDLIER